MDFLKDFRFAPYRESTTMHKYFPKQSCSADKEKFRNPIYRRIRAFESQEPNFEQSQVIKNQERKRSMIITNTKFQRNKSVQRISNINSIFDQIKRNRGMKKNRSADLKKLEIKYLDFNSLSQYAETFQKGIKTTKAKVKTMNKYNSAVKQHYQRYEITEEKTRKEIEDHEEIVQSLHADCVEQKSVLKKKSISVERIAQLSSAAPCQKRIKTVMDSFHRNGNKKTRTFDKSNFFGSKTIAVPNQSESRQGSFWVSTKNLGTHQCKQEEKENYQMFLQKENDANCEKYRKNEEQEMQEQRPSLHSANSKQSWGNTSSHTCLQSNLSESQSNITGIGNRKSGSEVPNKIKKVSSAGGRLKKGTFTPIQKAYLLQGCL